MDNIIVCDISWISWRGNVKRHKVAIPSEKIMNCDVFFKKYYKLKKDTNDRTKVKTKGNVLKGTVLSAKQNVLKVRSITIKKIFGFERTVESDRYVKVDDILTLSRECEEYKNQVNYWSLPPLWKKMQRNEKIIYENENNWLNGVMLPTLLDLPITPPPCDDFYPVNSEISTQIAHTRIWGRNYDVCSYCGNSRQKHQVEKAGGKRSIMNRKIKSSKKRCSSATTSLVPDLFSSSTHSKKDGRIRSRNNRVTKYIIQK
jgi:hypothetical protein